MKIKKKEVKVATMYDYNSYKESGVYDATDENGNSNIVIVNKEANFPTVYFMGPIKEWLSIFQDEVDVKSEIANDPIISKQLVSFPDPDTVSEKFALKMLAVAINSDKIDKLQ
jgi:hypothetical protein